jgi:hypothetical protein
MPWLFHRFVRKGTSDDNNKDPTLTTTTPNTTQPIITRTSTTHDVLLLSPHGTDQESPTLDTTNSFSATITTPHDVDATAHDPYSFSNINSASYKTDILARRNEVGPKLIIVMVGLPARGKSYICKKLCKCECLWYDIMVKRNYNPPLSPLLNCRSLMVRIQNKSFQRW